MKNGQTTKKRIFSVSPQIDTLGFKFLDNMDTDRKLVLSTFAHLLVISVRAGIGSCPYAALIFESLTFPAAFLFTAFLCFLQDS